MSPDGQSGGGPPAGLVVDLGPNEGFDLHVHHTHQLALAQRGVLVMTVGRTSWVLPPTRALWLPAGVSHSVAASGQTTMLSACVRPDRCALRWETPTVVDVSGLVRELVGRLSPGGVWGGGRGGRGGGPWGRDRAAPGRHLVLAVARRRPRPQGC